MPSLIDLRRRIRSVKNTQQITKAMKMVSAAKLRRAQDAVVAARPYANSLRDMLANVAAATDSADMNENALLARREEKRIQIVMLTSDRGLAGAFNANIIRAMQKFIAEHPNTEQLELEAVGRKGRDAFRKRGVSISGEHLGLFQKPIQYSSAQEIARKVIDRYRKGEIDAVYVIYNEFKSVMAQQVTLTRILPVETPKEQPDAVTNYIYEQPPGELLAALLPKYIEVSIYRAMLESLAAEHAARMTAMEAASKNSGEVIERLTLYMNRVRQASITKEIIEVVSGASAAE